MITRAAIDDLFRLANSHQPVLIEMVPDPFKRDLLTFIEGRTIVKSDDKWAVLPQDYYSRE